MDYYDQIKQKILDDEIYGRVKDYSKEKHKVITYFEIGKLLYEAGGIYGEDIIGQYSNKLQVEVGKKYNRSTLFRMRKFYIIFSDEKVAPMAQQLSWSHYMELLPLKDNNKILYYINQCILLNLSRNELRIRIKNREYERLNEKTKLKLINREENSKVEDLIKEPIIINNPNNIEVLKEKVLQKLILEDISSFLKELGNGFAFIDNEYKIKLGDKYNFIDLLLYNVKYKCYVVVELKVTVLKKEHIGQIQMYMNYIDKNIRAIDDDKTIGIIVVKKNDKYIMEYCSDKRILSKEYELV